MAAGEILYCGVKTGWSSTKGYYIEGLIQFSYNTAYKLKDESLRVYYTTTPGNSNAPHVDIVPPDSTATGENILKADTWVEPFKILPFGNLKLKSPILGLTNDRYTVTFTIGNLNAGTTYYTRAWLRLFKKTTSTSPKKSYKSPTGDQKRYKITTLAYEESRPLFCVAKYVTAPNDTVAIEWEDFTDCIKLLTYDVNSEDINEDWDDANYETHRIVARKRVTGKFEMIFPSMTRQKEFFHYVEESKQLNEFGIAYTELKVLVNNVLDTRNGVSIAQTQPLNYIGKFFLKIDNNAWIAPKFGHYDEYSPLSISIQEA